MGFNVHEITTDMTKQLCHFIKTLKYEDIPPAVIEQAKMMVMQTCGVSLCSAQLKQVRDAMEIYKEMSPGEEGCATLWADGKKVSWEAAAFTAGTMGDALDWEDCSVTGHPSAGVIPAAVIASEVLHRSGKELLTAVVAGYEVYQRVALAGRSSIASYNIFGILPVLMKLLDLPEEKMNQAFGVGTACAIIPANVHEITMSDSLNYLYGYRMENCVTMIKTALNGIENMEDAFDDPTAYLAHCGYQEPEWLTKELGTHWMMMDMLLVKHWPANVFVQTYAELASRLVTRYCFNPDEVDEIIIRPSVAFRHWYSETGYESLTQAQFSIPYVTACAMYHPEPGALWYQPETMKDARIIALMNKVKADGFVKMSGMKFIKDLIDGKHPEKFMIVRLKDGTEYTESAFTHPGHPRYMLTRDEFKERFRLETKNILSKEKTEGAIECICHLEECPDASVLPGFFH
ncbi:MmgE/PrpD family protein [Lachnoclostridium pacaense]|uniref:MmgE/PrpD family protein n=1 Tax=Enterocloster hominis (ex Hitch et al. 2024) TaxID=1917870 RepID=UPI001D0FBA3B|nr:MmgE/PrpD family protein [Lachnoclostridium pacaense]MCC2879611.1 MmgE/PrpD family protein [Lachnoclostridium pacaense]